MPEKKLVRWALFTTNYGRTAINTLELIRENKLKDVEIGLVLYENLPSGAAQLAEEMGIETARVIKSEFESRKAFEEHLVKLLDENEIDFIFLLGFGYFLQHDMLKKYEGKIINMHPSILPAFPGKRAMQQALKYGVKISGITTHYIDKDLDKGKIICQNPVVVKEGDTMETLDERYVKEFKPLLIDTFQKVMKLQK